MATFTANYTTIVRVETDDGIVGYGECLARYQPRVWADLVQDVLGPAIIGEDPYDVEWIWHHLYRSFGSFSGHSRGILLEAMSGIDLALWDLMGKQLGQPVHRLLGGFRRTEIDAYASSVTVAPLDAMVAEGADFVRRGFRAVKVKIGRTASEERETLGAIRDAVGPDVEIMVDANGAYAFPEAVRVAEVLAELDVSWFEEPVRTEDRQGYVNLRHATSLRLAAGEGEFTRFGMRDLLETGAIDVIQPDVCRSGGITETRKLWALATLYNAAYAPHVGASGAVCAAASVHLAASAPNFLTYECSVTPNPLRDDLVVEPVGHASSVVDGRIPVPTRPGLGVEIDERVLERYRVDA